jgi:quercetin dioxygenase-like cupin family protein
MTDEQGIKILQEENCKNVYVWNAQPHEDDPTHSHPYDTALLVLEGEILIKMNNQIIKLEPEDRLEIPKGVVHSAKAGQEGCKYVVGKK